MKPTIFLVLLLISGSSRADSPQEPSISIDPFRSSIHHWRNIRDQSRFIQVVPGQPSYATTQVREIAANILLFQRENGGWPKDYDMTAVLTPEQTKIVAETRSRADTSYDNSNIHSQVEYLARAYTRLREPSWRQACERGFDFILSSQYPNGGFPQRYPNPKSFHAHITFNDGVMIGALNLLADASQGAPHFEWLDTVRRKKADDAVRRGLDCILRCQIRVDGTLTGWCQQHDETNFEARPGRTFEPASICPQETTEIVRFLMRLGPPEPRTLTSTDAAIAWLRRSALHGIRVSRVKAPKEEFLRHDADFDVVVVPDAKAPPIWARHYEIDTARPVFSGRDGVRKYALAEIERERRTGTPWYGTWPSKLIDRDDRSQRQQLEKPQPEK